MLSSLIERVLRWAIGITIRTLNFLFEFLFKVLIRILRFQSILSDRRLSEHRIFCKKNYLHQKLFRSIRSESVWPNPRSVDAFNASNAFDSDPFHGTSTKGFVVSEKLSHLAQVLQPIMWTFRGGCLSEGGLRLLRDRQCTSKRPETNRKSKTKMLV